MARFHWNIESVVHNSRVMLQILLDHIARQAIAAKSYACQFFPRYEKLASLCGIIPENIQHLISQISRNFYCW